jgi:trigger factor
VRADLENELKSKQRRDVRNQLVNALLGRANVDLPDSLLELETRGVVYDIVRANAQRGVPKEALDEKKDEIYSVASSSARERLKATFLLNRIAEKEGIQVTDQELSQQVLYLAAQQQVKPEKLVKQLQEDGGLANLRQQISSAKTLDFLELNAQVEDVPASAPAPAAEGNAA